MADPFAALDAMMQIPQIMVLWLLDGDQITTLMWSFPNAHECHAEVLRFKTLGISYMISDPEAAHIETLARCYAA